MRRHEAPVTGLLLGAVVAAAVAGPASAAVPKPNRMLGPSFPAIVDTHGNGQPNEATDVKVVPSRSGTLITLANPWDTCRGGTTNKTFNLTAQDVGGKYRTTLGPRNDGGSQGLSITGFDGNNRPTSFSGTYTRIAGPVTYVATGTGSYITGSGPVPTGFRISVQAGTTVNVESDFVFSDVDADGNSDYLSVPFAVQSLLGVRPFPAGCTVPGAGTASPQVWIPLADSNGDGIPDSIVFDLDGNGQADPDLYAAGPALVASPCDFAVAPGAANAPAAGASSSFAVTTGNASCVWSASSGSSWLTLPAASGTGPGPIAFTAAPNTSQNPRTGTITVSGRTFTVYQAGVATATLFVDGSVPGDKRFKVEVDWSTVQGGGQGGQATAVATAPIGFSRGGIFWYFDPANPEMLVKIVNGCSVNQKYWVFSSAGTNVGLSAKVTDTSNGAVKTYVNPDLTAAQPVQDVQAFACN